MDANQQTTEIVGAFPLASIRSMLWSDDTLCDIPLQSKGIGDTAKVFKVKLPIGQYITYLDPEEFYFHVELYSRHAELWLSIEWRESNARRSRQRTAMAEEHRVFDIYQTRKIELIARIPNILGPDYQEHLASILLAEHKKGNNNQVLRSLDLLKLVGIGELLERYEKEDANEKETS